MAVAAETFKTSDVARHGNGGHEIAPLPHQPPESMSFGPQNQGGWYRQIQVIVWGLASASSPTVQTPASLSSSTARAMLTTSATGT